MRERQTEETNARIVLGGKIGPTLTAAAEGGTTLSWYSGRIPGVIEEALVSLRARKPVYVCGAFGGAARAIADLLKGQPRADFTWDFHKQAPHSEAMRRLYEQHEIPFSPYADMTRYLADKGVDGLSQDNGLSRDENLELFECRDTTRIVELILVGTARKRYSSTGRASTP